MTDAGDIYSGAVRDALDRPLRDLRVSVTDRCNLRCTYCMPAEVFDDEKAYLPRQKLLRFEEIARVTRLAAELGVVKVRITGGEPLLRRKLPDLIRQLVQTPGIEDVALTTNGILLAKFAAELKAAGLHRVTVSLDSVDDAVFGKMNGRGVSSAEVLKGIDAALAVGLGPVKVNCVVQRGVNDHTVLELVERFRGTACVLRFIEYMDVGTMNGWNWDQVVPARELVAMVGEKWPLRALEENYRGEVAQRYAFEDGQGEIGMITSVSQPFCGACNRLRMSPDGQLYMCLFGVQGVDLRTAMRMGDSDAHIKGIIAEAWKVRADRYSEERAALTEPRKKVEMYHIGG